MSLDDGWRFIKEDVPGAEAANFQDNQWQTISLPHTWNNLDGEDGGNNYYRGPGWYRRNLTIDAALAAKSLFLKFDGAATVADVWVNGQVVGEHKGNFGAFCYDITPLVHTGADNVIAVKVNNAYNPDVPPRSGDFTISGGLYRDVHLLALDRLSVTPLDYASPGVFIKQSHVTDEGADLEITTELRNSNPADKNVTVRCTILDRDGKTVQSLRSRMKAGAGVQTNVVQQVTLRHPHLWNGRIDPYLYTVTTEVMDGARKTDEVTQPLGIRYFRVDPNEGFFLNGKHYELHGVTRHQDRIDKGWAIGPAEHLEDYNLITEMGCTGIRLAHYQHADYFYSLCDQGGLVVWAELCLVNSLNDTEAFRQNARQQLTELIKQNYNHPSILFWGLFNELSFGRGKTADNDAGPHPWDLIAELNGLAHQLDPTRLTTAATNLNPSHPANFITDVIAFNRYPGWYGGNPTEWAGWLDDFHRKYPTRSLGISEYGAGASIHQHEQNPVQPKAGGPWHPEEWQSVVHEDAWNAMKTRPYIWGTFLWNMFDFASDGRREGDTPGRNDKGMVTYDRKTRKDSFFWYQANWTSAPMMYITSRRFTPRTNPSADVKVYSNCSTVELSVNGKSMGSKTSDDHIFLWPAVMLGNGENRLEAVGLKDGKTTRDSCVWVYSALPQ
ncbi:MAG: glycoside hydrolase family 2 protein [Armatimonadota bacterium]|nr:glycoside hydrolase family 2 protein [Armatimonadota bacterium]